MDADLTTPYDVLTIRFNEVVKRRLSKCLPDFMFTLSEEEFAALRSRSATSKAGSVGCASG